MNTCLACHKPLEEGNSNYHEKCLSDFWQADPAVHVLDYELTQITELAKENLLQRVTITGIQPKLSLGFIKSEEQPERLTIVGAFHGRYILKPPYHTYPAMPETEALSMCMAQACGIATVPFLLLRLKDGHLAYLTRRIDRSSKGEKLPMEDTCQLTNKLTESKYRGSYEQIARCILAYAHNPLLDVVRFYEQVIFSFLTGNNDMHLKNFSLIAGKDNSYELAPAYDLIAAQLLIPQDTEDLALTLNGKKNRLSLRDFNLAMKAAGIPPKAIDNLWKRIAQGVPKWPELIKNSFLEETQKEEFRSLIKRKTEKLELTAP